MNESYLPPQGGSPQPGYPPPPPRSRGPGCFAVGCLVVVIVGVIVAGLLGGLGWYLYSGLRPFVGTQPVAIRTAPATQAQYAALLAKSQAFQTKLSTDPTATLELSADDLNTYVAYAPEAKNARGRVFFTLDNDALIVETSFPVPSKDQSPGRPVYYFNGKAHLSASFEDGEFTFAIRKLEALDGKPVPAVIQGLLENPNFTRGLNQGFNENFRKQTDRSPAATEMLARLRSIAIRNNQVVVTAEGQPAPAR